MGGVVRGIGNLVGGVGGIASGVAGAIPGIGPIAGPVIGAITGGPLGFARSVGGNILQGNYGGGGGGGGGGDGGGGGGNGVNNFYSPIFGYDHPIYSTMPSMAPVPPAQNTAPPPPVQDTAPVPPAQNPAPYRPNPPPVPTTQNRSVYPPNHFDTNQYYLNIGREQGRFPPPAALAINRAQSGSGQVPFGIRPPQLGSGKSPLRQDILGPNRAPAGGITTLNRPGMGPLSRFGRR